MSIFLERIAVALERIADSMETERDANAATRMLATALLPRGGEKGGEHPPDETPQWRRDRMAATNEARR